MFLSLPLFFKTRTQNQGVRAKTAYQLSTLNLDRSIPKGGRHSLGQQEREKGGRRLQLLQGSLDGAWRPGSRSGRGTLAPCLTLGGPPFLLLSPPPQACPSLSGGTVSHRQFSRRSLHCLCLYNRFRRQEDARFRGRPNPGFLAAASFLWGCACLRLLLFGSRTNSPEEQPPGESDPSFCAPLPARAAAWAQSVGMLCTLEGPSSSRACGVLPFFC